MLTKFLNFSSQHTLSFSQSLNLDEIKYSLKEQFILSKNTSLWIDRSTVINGPAQPMTDNRHTNGDALKSLYFSESNMPNGWRAMRKFLLLKNHLKSDCRGKTASVYSQIGQLPWWLMSKASQWTCTRRNLQMRCHHCLIYSEAIATKVLPAFPNTVVNEHHQITPFLFTNILDYLTELWYEHTSHVSQSSTVKFH